MSRRAWALGLALLLAAGCGRPDPARRPRPPAEVLDFGKLYGTHCAGCHGADGQFGPAPPLNDALFLALIPDATLKQVVRDGRPGTLMPAFGQERQGELTDEQIDVLAAGLRRTWGREGAGQGAPPYLVAAAPSGNEKAGARVYAVACACCHGDHGQGGDAGPLNDPAFLALLSDQALRRLVFTGRPDLGMPDYQTRGDRPEAFRPLTSQEVSDVVALLASWRQPSPAGPSDAR